MLVIKLVMQTNMVESSSGTVRSDLLGSGLVGTDTLGCSMLNRTQPLVGAHVQNIGKRRYNWRLQNLHEWCRFSNYCVYPMKKTSPLLDSLVKLQLQEKYLELIQVK